jgi:fimbrial chaperone protein
MKAASTRTAHAVAVFLCCLAANLPSGANAGDFSVAPIRLYLDKDRKTDVVTVRNNGTEPLQFEIRPRQWTQGPAGADVYVDTGDLLVFPRLMTLNGGEDRDIRIGTKIPPGAREKTYRVYINELPPKARPESTDRTEANIGFLINFALPVFLAPLKPAPGLDIVSFDLRDGQFNARVANTGNVHQYVEEMAFLGYDASGKEIYRRPVSDRYFLAGTAKPYTESIKPGDCEALAVVAFSVSTDKLSANAKKDVDKNSCGSGSPTTPARNSAR